MIWPPQGKSFADITARALARGGKEHNWDLRTSSLSRARRADIRAAGGPHYGSRRQYDRIRDIIRHTGMPAHEAIVFAFAKQRKANEQA